MVIPAESAEAASAAPCANSMFLSSTVKVVELIVVVVPSTCRLPWTINVPAAPPGVGSRIILPEVVLIVFPSIRMLSTSMDARPETAESRWTNTCAPWARSALVVFTFDPPLTSRLSPLDISPVPDRLLSAPAKNISIVST